MYVIAASVLNLLIKKRLDLSDAEMKAAARKNRQALEEMGVWTLDPQNPDKMLLPEPLKNELTSWLPEEPGKDAAPGAAGPA